LKRRAYDIFVLFKLFKKRITWLVVLFFGEMFTATAMGYFQDELAKVLVLASFIPLILSTGGNTGVTIFHTHYTSNVGGRNYHC